MTKTNGLRMQAHRSAVCRNGRVRTKLTVWQISLIADDRHVQVPKVKANLVCTACMWSYFEQCRSIGKLLEHFEIGARRVTG